MLREKNFSSISTTTRRNVMEITWCYVARTSPELTLRQKTLTCTSTVLQPDATLYQLLDATSQELFQRWGYVIRTSLALLLPGDHKYGKKKVWPARKTWKKCAKSEKLTKTTEQTLPEVLHAFSNIDFKMKCKIRYFLLPWIRNTRLRPPSLRGAATMCLNPTAPIWSHFFNESQKSSGAL